jgi:hypothetical protein
MKFNWGHGIILASLFFMLFIVTLVIKTYSHKVDLVSEDYYNQELHFQERINKMNNVSEADKVVWKIQKREIIFQFPQKMNSSKGTIEFFRPSDSSKDWKIPIDIDSEGKQYLHTEILLHGLYKIKIDWIANSKEYYMEEDIYIQ